VDVDYLQGTLKQSGGKLKGDYYIIAPETCVRVGETELKNANGERHRPRIPGKSSFPRSEEQQP